MIFGTKRRAPFMLLKKPTNGTGVWNDFVQKYMDFKSQTSLKKRNKNT